jgi:hypothetical protein
MKRALITMAAVGILAPTAWVAGANAQYGAPAPAYAPAPTYAPVPAYGPSRRYARRAYRSARRTYGAQTYGTRGAPPATYAGNTAFTPGSGGQPYAVYSWSICRKLCPAE